MAINNHGIGLHTVTEGHVDQIKFGVAALLGAIFLKNLVDKTLRGMAAAVAAGRIAGGRSYGYASQKLYDQDGERIRGYLEIAPEKAEVVRRICRDFANGLSSIQIAKALNEEGIAGPRGGAWNASTIRGDPKRHTGILNNPLYVGRLVWGRRQWRRNPDSENRERRYKMRDASEWLEIEVPDLRIVDDKLWEAVQAEIKRRQRTGEEISPADQNRKKHLLSGLIKCSCCGSNYTISGKDYYRCAGQKERGTCGNKLSIRKGALENAALSVLQHHLFTEDHARLFVETFNREVTKITGKQIDRDRALKERLVIVEMELANLSANLLSGVLSPTLAKLLADREAEKVEIELRLAQTAPPQPVAQILPHPVLMETFARKIAALRETLDDEAVRNEAAALMDQLIERVTIYPNGIRGPEAEIVSKVADLVSYALNDNAAPGRPWGGGCSSTAVVAGVGFEPTTFRL
ncbi:Recombinase [Sphingomonas paucimobilis]|nr:Recombinase [Sphingomonas paucimobilis]